MGKDPLKAEETAVRAANRPENFLAPLQTYTLKSKREKDRVRPFHLERQRLFREAFHHNIVSIGELDALTGSEPLNVDRGDVL